MIAAARLVKESKKGDGLMIEVLRSDLKKKQIDVAVSQIASKVSDYDAKGLLCLKAGESKQMLGYTMIRSLLINNLSHQ